MSEQPQLFASPPARAGYPDHLYGGRPPHAPTSETSRAAAESVRESAQSVRRRVLELIRQRGGLTADEVAVLLGTMHNTTSPRVTELVLTGQLVDSGHRRRTRTGRQAVVWIEVDP